ncbi:toxin [Photorhabdus laumondii subsp. laumondii]|uniref:Insecticidal toxin complex protein TcdA4 n=2 Tax=Photorhabdus laumondii subsp. laumondii TaxID=141679 RepID=Q7N7Y6_PHOLL|nr:MULTISPECIES: neuraminidase-like domain-containing protein [Photorhabdus]AWK40888.1 toxin [Photorhabdus laumondii subsp. laumondii]AXG45178.1 toxin [Photorhabdus laumondii subsp. laumondii]AXG46224.1 toxin [Photorhabdus laumondii subsp. laumondii]MCC8383669.1 toxin [Photorhabdus laumondii]MCC8388047.1 toxin [Photorhabdus laumondii]
MNSYVKEIPDVLQSQCGINCLTDICHYSFNEFRQQVSDHLSWSETNRLYRDAQQEQKENQLYEASILKRANPQLQNAVHLGITLPHAELQGYNNEFGGRASQYVAPGSVSSMFSPAAYLTELYREARNLHASDSVYHLDQRRPDLQSMTLNQQNMDTELSTLSLSNEILLEGVKANQPNLDNDTKVMAMLSTFRPSGTIPYHDAYENVRKAIQLQDPQLKQFQQSPAVAGLMHQASLLGINNSISPELFNILTEEITEANAEDVYKKNFGDIDPTWLAMPEYLKSYYNLSDEELSQFIRKYPNNELNTQKIHLLKINKIILLSRSVNLPFVKLDEIIPEQSINPSVLGKIFLVKYYMQKYNIDTETALILCNNSISQYSYRNQPSQFDRLFNTPPLNGQCFVTEDTNIDLNLNSTDTDNWHKTVLKRAFNVDDISLYRLLHIANHENKDGKIANNIKNLSNLYMTKLLADIHQLTIDELYLLLMTIGEDKRDLYTIDDKELEKLINRLDSLSNWLRTQKWSVYQLFLMTTTNYDKTLTPEIQNLLNTVYNGLQNFDENKKDLLTTISPYIAATLQLPSENVAHSILLWADKIKPSEKKITTEKFWDWLQNRGILELSKPPEMQEQIIQYCHCLAQLTMIYRSSGINENAFRLFIEQPTIFGISDEPDKATPAHNAPTLIILTRFANWVNTLGEKASPILTAFENKILTAEQLANAMNLDANLLEQASIQAQNYKQVTKENTFSNWQSIDIILQWTNVANDFNISPQGISSLIALDYIQPSQKTPTYSQWENAAMVLTAGLDTQQMNTLHAFLDESRSTALSNYYISKIANRAAAIKSRDDLYQYLLIDNQVSAAIKTTRIAEAIASIQLYVNRALENIETHAISDVITRQFFIDWDKYNKRYSTWAGVSQLAYYPENYIDPTMRIGQTKMMDTLLQSVSQSQLNADTVEDAFKSYLTSFEQVANLEVISAYHDNVNNDQGLTYFIGHSKTEINQYYWRSVDHSKFNDGKFAANAWSEWHKIDCAINPYQSTIRPVIYKSRLYLIWLEQKEIAKQDKDNKVITDYYYELKLAHIRYDGTWNTPIAFDVNSKISALELAKSQAPGLYCAGYQGEDTLLVMFYRKKEKLDDYKTAPMQGFYIFSDMSSKEMTNEQCNSYRDNGYTHFDTNSDTNSVIRINNRYAEDYEIPSLINHSNSHDWGEYNLSQVYGGNIVINYEVASSDLKIKISPKLRIIHEGKEGRERIQCDLMKKYGKLGDKFIIYTNINKNPNHSKNEKLIYPVYQYRNNDKGCLLFYRSNTTGTIRAWFPTTKEEITATTSSNQDCIIDTINNIDLFKAYFYMEDKEGQIATDISGATDINTGISSEKVQIIINAGKEYSLTANKDVSVQPSPSFEEMCYQFNALEIDGSSLNFTNNSASIDVTFIALADDGRKLGYEIFNIPVIQKVKTDNALTLFHDKNGAQYMQWGAYRVRLNTLFARQLVERATTGIDTILSMETQNIQEPMMGIGAYIEIVMDKYNTDIHGTNKSFKIMYGDIFKAGDHFPIYQGTLSDITQTTVKLFLPRVDNAYGNKNNLYVYAAYQKAETHFIRFVKEDNNKPATFDTTYNNGTFPGLASARVIQTFSEPMDFSGANSLYFWELFYYTPMLVAQRLLHEQNFDETNRWLKYVWSPSGYIVRGQIKNYRWNVRPFLENTSWNSDPLDSVDPDAVAQHDPMHYKVATFMRTLDLLMARGDHAYRQLERDTLNEAKMWYMQALHLLGDKPYLPLSSAWNNPRLDNAADTTIQKAYSYAITTLRQGTQTPALLLRSANTLTDLFLPQINDVMLSYWNKLELRLYNLRHNLSIDGQPLYLPMYATPADPKALLSAAVATSQGGGSLPQPFMSLWHFPHMLENARSMVAQLTQFGSTLQNIIERQDAEALNALLQNQAKELILTTLSIQDKTIEEIDAEKTVLEKSKAGAQSRFDNYSKLYDEDVNAGERQALDMRIASQSITSGLKGLHMAAAALEMVPNIYGFAVGGTRFGAIANAIAIGGGIAAEGLLIEAEKVSQSEIWRRRRQEWEIQRNNAEAEMKQIDAQLQSLTVRREAAVLQKTSLKTQQEQTQAQLAFLQRKFSNQALYNWLRGRLAAIYFQFYDLVVARCLMAEQAYRWETNDTSARFIKPGAWQGTYAGLLAGETLMLNLAQMEDAHLKQEQRALEVERTVSLAQVYQSLEGKSFTLKDKIEALLQEDKETSVGNNGNQLKLTNNTLSATLTLQDLKLKDDYPEEMQLGKTRRIKQISVSLPSLLGPYQDVQAVLSYGGDATGLAKGCKALAVSHGLNDNGQFQLDFNDGKFLPFEGIDINDKGTLTLSFPNATSKQKTILQMLTDIILHIRYTILE